MHVSTVSYYGYTSLIFVWIRSGLCSSDCRRSTESPTELVKKSSADRNGPKADGGGFVAVSALHITSNSAKKSSIG